MRASTSPSTQPGQRICELRIKARGHPELVTLVSYAAEISVGEWVTVSGSWVNDREHGQRFKATFLISSSPTTAEVTPIRRTALRRDVALQQTSTISAVHTATQNNRASQRRRRIMIACRSRIP